MNPFVTEARALCRDATDGPWHAGRADMGTFVDGYESKWIYAGEPAEKSKYLAVSSGYEIKEWDEVMANAHLIARSRTLLPDMADEIERLEAELATLKVDIEAGRLVRLPFKPGDVLYAIIPKSYEGDCDTRVSPWKSIAAVIYEDGSIAAMDCDENFDKIGTSYAYLTEAEARAALEGDKHG